MSFGFQQTGSAGGLAHAARGLAVPRLAGLVRWLVCRLLPVWCGLALFAGSAFFARSAAALEPSSKTLGSEVPAPMCDPDGASVAAAEDIPEVDRGHFEALPCEAQLLLAGWRLDAPEPGSKAVSVRGTEQQPPPGPFAQPQRPRCEGACSLAAQFPSRTEPVLGSFATQGGLLPSAGHARTLFRPPVVGA
jgi:hypothetical protein